jgi:hypothetical protein
MPKKLIETEGELQRWVEHTQDIVNVLARKLMEIGAIPKQMHELPTSDARWKAAKMMLDLNETLETIADSMVDMWGSTEGHLCPHEDCARDLAFGNIGWWTCPCCLRDFYATRIISTGEFKTYTTNPGISPSRKPDIVPMARDLGPSMLSPETWNDQD